MCRRLIQPSADSSTTPELIVASPNPAEEAALRQFQHQMRALRHMLNNNNQPPTDGQRDSRRPHNFQDLLGGDIFGFGGRSEERGQDRNEYVGMYS
jgi:hypothetical protein